MPDEPIAECIEVTRHGSGEPQSIRVDVTVPGYISTSPTTVEYHVEGTSAVLQTITTDSKRYETSAEQLVAVLAEADQTVSDLGFVNAVESVAHQYAKEIGVNPRRVGADGEDSAFASAFAGAVEQGGDNAE